MRVIDVDDPATWTTEVQDFVDDHAARLEGTTEHTSDLDIDPDQEDEFRKLLAGVFVKVYHVTRLLDHEVESIRQQGLTPVSEELVRSRTEQARANGYLTASERDQLLAGNLFGAGDYVANREGQICFFISRRVLDHSISGIWRPMATWGGEVIYFGAGIPEDTEARLKMIGSPTVVVAAIELTEGWRTHLASPGLLHSFVGKTLGLEPYDTNVFYRGAVPGEQILDIWQPGHPAFDHHTDLKEALEEEWDD